MESEKLLSALASFRLIPYSFDLAMNTAIMSKTLFKQILETKRTVQSKPLLTTCK